MIELYHSPRSRSMRTLWLLEELGLPYHLHEFAFRDVIQQKHHTEDYLKLHPLGLIPLVIDDDLTLFESGAICLYLTNLYDKEQRLAPSMSKRHAYPLYTQWVFWACCTLEPPVWSIVKHAFLLPKEKRNRHSLKSAMHKYHDMLKVLNQELSNRKYILSDEFSAADIMIASLLEWYPKALKDYPHIMDYREAYQARPAFKAAYKP